MPDFIALVRARLEAEGAGRLAKTDAVDEIAHHLADVYTAALRAGRSAAEAEAAAESELQSMPPLTEALAQRERRRERSVRREPPVRGAAFTTLAGDLRHACRLFRSRPAYTSLVVATLAIGLGACTAVFSLFNALLLRPLPYPDPERLVLAWEADADDLSRTFIVSAPNYQDWVSSSRQFESFGLWEYLRFNVSSDAEPEQVRGIRASSSLFQVLGIAPMKGRVFTAEEDTAGHHVAVISHDVWRTHLGGAEDALGRTLRLNGAPYTVVGVMPRGFTFPQKDTGIWVPMNLRPRDHARDSHSFYVAARLKRETTFEQARAEMQQIGRSLSERHEANRSEGATITPMAEYGLLNVREILIALSAAVALVLLIACVNVANLQMGLGLSRRREFVIRLALGAKTGRLAQQLFCESLVLAAAGGAAGVALAWMATRAIDLVLTPGFRTVPLRGDVPVAIDLRVLAFAVLASAVSAILFGLWPLVGLRRSQPHALLREGERGSTRLASGTRRVLVTAELALAIIVLCSAGLMIRSLDAVLRIESGLDPADVLTMQLSLPQTDTYGPPERAGFCRDLAEHVEALPGIRQVSAISHLPLSGANAGRGFVIEGRPAPGPEEPDGADYRLACPAYFSTLGIPIIAGRDFTTTDVREGVQVVIINRATQDQFWRGQDPIGQRIKLGGLESTNPWLTIVGVVENVRHFALEDAPRREIFRPYSQAVWPVMTIVAKTAGEPLAWQRAVSAAVHRIDPALPAINARSMEQVIAGSVAWRETPMRLLTGFALIGLILSALGVYGVLAYYVSQRTREIGVRVALGASRAGLVALVLKQSLVPIVAGIALGIAGSMGSATLLTGLLYEVEPTDPVVLVSVAGALTLVGLVASWLPARRAASIDPIVALREE